MSEPKRLCIVGATGLIGTAVIAQAVGAPDIRVTGIARREVALPAGAQMEMLLADPSGWDDAIAVARPDVFVCALGTTWAKAGQDKAAFRAIDYDLVLACARAAKAAGAGHMIVVSSVGASIAAKPFYLQVKGELEDALAKLHFRRLDILRPGLLRGEREGDRRPGERFASMISPLTDLFLHGGARKYRSIPAETVAAAILALARTKPGGRFVHEHDAMLYAIRRSGQGRG
jgi:uncharacterized protein YbjT (DUF2867 family)